MAGQAINNDSLYPPSLHELISSSVLLLCIFGLTMMVSEGNIQLGDLEEVAMVCITCKRYCGCNVEHIASLLK